MWVYVVTALIGVIIGLVVGYNVRKVIGVVKSVGVVCVRTIEGDVYTGIKFKKNIANIKPGSEAIFIVSREENIDYNDNK